MQTATKQALTALEYLALERASDVKHQFVNGEMFAMAGGSETHSLLAVSLLSGLSIRLRGRPCRVYNSDMRLKVEATEIYTYLDVHVACGGTKLEDEHRDTVLNPVVIVEVLSDSTAAWDRGEKFWHYRQIPSFQEYVLVSQEAWLLEHFIRQSTGLWVLETVEGKEGVLRLPAIHCEIPLTEIYGDTDLSPDARPASPQPIKPTRP